MPESLVDRVRSDVECLDSSILTGLPDYLAHQIRAFDQGMTEGQLKGVQRVVRALNLGYEPYTIPPYFYVAEYGIGFWQRMFNMEPVTDLTFRAVVPEDTRVRYEQARKQQVFDRVVVAAPDDELFARVNLVLRDILKDPVMVGFVPIDTSRGVSFEYKQAQLYRSGFSRLQSKGAPGAAVVNGESFLIARWGLAEDRAGRI